MTKDEFQQLAEAYGGDVARWPLGLREDAALFTAQDPLSAQATLAREASLDAALDTLPRAPAPRELYDRIIADAPAGRRRRRLWRLWLAPAGVGAALASVAAAGLVLGAQLGQQSAITAEASAQAVADLDVSAVAEEG
ncbi:MAG TPA: hypothetical protein VJS38_09310 [Phenylobacterium sp.]|uniref:hypothetical protein n=1 Tax=Phenylobacterium sp. TaxID=1871053 RepID=UPI002B48D57D|nr:hypothetical protein [Phenylobacterium sp.]HKR88362.1 hypothetical protein [Phenylobacterium sp.]